MSNSKHFSARERIEYLLDNNSFVEIGALVTKRNTDFNLNQISATADGVITGYGIIDCNPVYVYSQDVSALNGTVGEMHAKKIASLYDMAIKVGAPVIGLIDCGGLRLQEASDALNGFGEIYSKQIMASGVIPQITAVFGKCGGASAMNTSLSDFTFMLKDDAKLFVNAPNTLDANYVGNNNTSSAEFQAKYGNIDFVCDTEEEMLGAINDFVRYLPSNNEDNESYEECVDDLNRINNLSVGFKDSALILKEIADDNVFIEVKKDYAKEMVTGFIRLNGMVIGAVANRGEIFDNEGKVTQSFDNVLTSAGCIKADKFVRICDAFNIPILTLTDTKGFMATIEEEQSIARNAARLAYAFTDATVPKVNVITGKAYGTAYVVMNSKHIGADMVFAWNGTEVGAMESADMAAKIICAGESNPEIINKTADEYKTLQSSVGSASARGYVDTIIEPKFTRKNLIYAFEMLFTKREGRLSKKHGTV